MKERNAYECMSAEYGPVEEQYLTNMPLLVQRKEMLQCLKLNGG